MRRFWLAFLLVMSVGFSVPSVALADDGLIDSFSGGLQTLVSPESVKVEETVSTPESEYLDSYEPELRVVETVELTEESTPLQGIASVINKANSVQNGATSSVSLQVMTRWFLQNQVVPIAILLVFMWWGVRKVVRMIKSAWYKGHASV